MAVRVVPVVPVVRSVRAANYPAGLSFLSVPATANRAGLMVRSVRGSVFLSGLSVRGSVNLSGLAVPVGRDRANLSAPVRPPVLSVRGPAFLSVQLVPAVRGSVFLSGLSVRVRPSVRLDP